MKNNCTMKKSIVIAVGILCLSLFILGIVLVATYKEKNESKFEYDYTKCLKYDTRSDTFQNLTCAEFRNNSSGYCICFINLTITEDLYGDVPLTLYYDLSSYEQPNYSQSKDENQLLGKISETPAAQCEPYSYLNGIPIYPCGALANFMFNDTFILKKYGFRDPWPTVSHGMIKEEDKIGYRNPPGDLEKALQNFTKPPNWVKNVWELDTTYPDNNGIQNERFIGWMKTNWRRKPFWQLNDTILPSGRYFFRVDYNYPQTLYNGPRKIILSTYRIESNLFKLVMGTILLIIGLIVLLLSTMVYFKTIKKLREKY